MFVWVFVSALIVSHVVNFYQSRVKGFTDFTIDGATLIGWIQEIDPSAHSDFSGGSIGSSPDECHSDMEYDISTDSIGSEEILDHIRDSFRQKAERENWSISGSGGSDDSFKFTLSNGVTRFRIYCWIMPVNESSYGTMLEKEGKSLTRVKLIQIGYRFRQ